MRVEPFTEVTGEEEVYLLVRLTAEAPKVSGRRPVNLAVALDRSSSMRGPRLAQAVLATSLLVEQLTLADRLCIVAFDAEARIVFGPTPVAPEGRAQLLAELAALTTGIGTNLAAGIRKGAEAIRSGFVRDAICRLLLLTDGQPSIGITDSEQLGALVAHENQRGVTTTSMGLGEGFDDELLAELARRGGGGFYYLAEPSDIPAAFGRELAGVFALAATRTQIKLVPAEGIAAIDLLHRLPSRSVEDGLLVEVGELAAGAPRQVLFRLRCEPRARGRRCGTLAVSYRDAEGKAGYGHVVGIEIPEPATESSPRDEGTRSVTLERLRLEVARAVDRVWARRASAHSGKALARLQAVKERVAGERSCFCSAGDELVRAGIDQLLGDIAEAEQAVARSEEERERCRRAMRERSYVTFLGYSSAGQSPRDKD